MKVSVELFLISDRFERAYGKKKRRRRKKEDESILYSTSLAFSNKMK
jgi:hypothetical protein